MGEGGIWRPDIDSLAFEPQWHRGQCVMHRLAFRTLMGEPAAPKACLAFFQKHRDAFEKAARAKVARKSLAGTANFHLTSRDLRHALAGE